MTGFGPITQLGYLTDDIEAAATLWANVMGVGPWTVMSDVTMPAVMDGEPTEILIDVALSYQNGIQVELIQPKCDSPSPYKKNREIGLWGSHHTQFTVDDLDAAIAEGEAAGMETACVIESAGARYIYMRGVAGWIEITAPNAGLEMFFGMIKKSCEDWDGTNVFHAMG